MSAPRVAVLVVTWNGWRDAIECLESIFQSDYPNFRVLLCDNASPDGTLARIREWAAPRPSAECTRAALEDADHRAPDSPLVLIQTGANLGFAGGNNTGLRAVLADPEIAYVWLLNPDTVVERGALRAMVDLAEREAGVGIVGSKVMYHDAPDTIQAIGGGEVIRWQGMTRFLGRDERDHGQWDRPLEPDYITGCSMLVRTELIRAIGLMDESYFLYSEEVDWCIRARRAGWRLLYCPESTIWHKEGRSVGKRNPLADYYAVRNSLLLTRKFYPALIPLAFVHSIFRCLLPKVLRLEVGRLRAVLRAYRGFFARGKAERGEARGRAVTPRGEGERPS